MMSRSWSALRLLTIALSAGVAGCGSSTEVGGGVETIAVSVGSSGSRNLTMNKGEVVPLTVVSRDANGQTVQPGSDFAFVSRSTAVATVTKTGVVTGQNVGTTYVVVSLSTSGRTISDSIQVHVNVGT